MGNDTNIIAAIIGATLAGLISIILVFLQLKKQKAENLKNTRLLLISQLNGYEFTLRNMGVNMYYADLHCAYNFYKFNSHQNINTVDYHNYKRFLDLGDKIRDQNIQIKHKFFELLSQIEFHFFIGTNNDDTNFRKLEHYNEYVYVKSDLDDATINKVYATHSKEQAELLMKQLVEIAKKHYKSEIKDNIIALNNDLKIIAQHNL